MSHREKVIHVGGSEAEVLEASAQRIVDGWTSQPSADAPPAIYPRIEDTSETMERVPGEEVAQALGAVRADAPPARDSRAEQVIDKLEKAKRSLEIGGISNAYARVALKRVDEALAILRAGR